MDNPQTKEYNNKIITQIRSCLDDEKYNNLNLLNENERINSEGKIDWKDFVHIMSCMNWETEMLWDKTNRLEKEKDNEEKMKNHYKAEASYQKSRKIKSRIEYKKINDKYKDIQLEKLNLEMKIENIKKTIDGLDKNTNMNISKYFEKFFPSKKTVCCLLCYNDVEDKDLMPLETCSNNCNINICNKCFECIDKCPNCRNNYEYEIYYNNEDYESEGDEDFNYLDLYYDNINVGEAVSIMFDSEDNQTSESEVKEDEIIENDSTNRLDVDSTNTCDIYSLNDRDDISFIRRFQTIQPDPNGNPDDNPMNFIRILKRDEIGYYYSIFDEKYIDGTVNKYIINCYDIDFNFKELFKNFDYNSFMEKLKKDKTHKIYIKKLNSQQIYENRKNKKNFNVTNDPVHETESCVIGVLQQPKKDD